MQSENGEDGEDEEEGNEGDDEATKEEHSLILTFSVHYYQLKRLSDGWYQKISQRA